MASLYDTVQNSLSKRHLLGYCTPDDIRYIVNDIVAWADAINASTSPYISEWIYPKDNHPDTSMLIDVYKMSTKDIRIGMQYNSDTDQWRRPGEHQLGLTNYSPGIWNDIKWRYSELNWSEP